MGGDPNDPYIHWEPILQVAQVLEAFRKGFTLVASQPTRPLTYHPPPEIRPS